MKKRLLILILLISVYLTSNYAGTPKTTGPSKATTELGKKKLFKRMKAYFRYRGEDYNGALRIYREIYEVNKNDAKINFLIGKCNVQLNNMDDALVYLKKALKLEPTVDKSIHFYIGEAYQYLGKIDSAVIEYKAYESTFKNSKPSENDPVVDLLSQAETAQNMMAHPVNVTITNMGPEVNSEFDDGMPQISADGNTLIFTSRRSDTKGGGIDPNTGQYYDDVYMSVYDEASKKWKAADDVEGDLNTAGHDAVLGMSADGKTIFVYRNIPKVTGSGDIYFSTKKADDKWSKPKPLAKPVNSTFFEGSCSLSPDGSWLYFVSERNGGYGNADIWKSKRLGKNIWGKPVNLGPVINTEGDEMSVFMHPDGKTLFFSSNGHKTMGGYDIFMSQMKADSTWTEPVNLGYPINTTKNELTFTMTADGKKAYITSNKPGGLGGADIYEIDMTKYDFPIKIEGQVTTATVAPKVETDLSILKGSVIESSAAQALEAEVSIKDVATGKISKVLTSETGDYFITLKGDKEYEITVEKEGYKKYSEKVTLPYDKDKTYTLVKLIVLEKLPEEKK